jgi:hypothetical protein
MKTALRLVLVACLGVVALVVAGSAMAAYQPRIVVENPTNSLSAASSLVLRVCTSTAPSAKPSPCTGQPRDDDGTFRLNLLVPQGYTTSLVPTEGQTIGTVTAHAQANAISPDAILELTGNIVGDPTFTATEYPQAAGCLTGTGITAPDAVYRLVLTAAGQTLTVPMYVEPIVAPSPLATGFSAQIVTCLPSPYIPQASGGAAFGAKLLAADLTFNGIFTNPATAGDYRWSAVWTPYTVGTGTPNIPGTVEVQSVDRLTHALTVASRVRARTVTVSGTLLEAGRGIPSARVQIQLGRTAGALRNVATVTTRANGSFSAIFRNRAPGVWFARARVTVADRATPCVATFASLGIPCSAANVPGFANFQSRAVRFRIR